MSRTTRIKRKTYATPRHNPPGRMVHQSTNYAWLPMNFLTPNGPQHFVKVGPGVTFRRTA
jgi:hypothetical protein